MNDKSKILLPLDADTADRACELAAALSDDVYGFKVGLELINAAGFDIFDRLRAVIGRDAPLFYDCKFHDIPNTVAGATRAAAARGVWMLNVHASGGSAMMRAAVEGATEGASRIGCAKPLVIAVTLLTSIDKMSLSSELGHPETTENFVVRLARLAQDSGCDGVVASPHEVEAIRKACGEQFLLVVPGVRPADAAVGDQKRVMTPVDAVRAGSDYLVIGRPITASPNPSSAARAINDQISAIRNIR